MLIYPNITLICNIYIYICVCVCVRVCVCVCVCVMFFNFVKLNTVLIEKGSHKRYAMPNALVV